MARSETYLTLQRTIADELGDRQDLLAPLSDSSLTLSPIQSAIQSAIAKWEREPFYFNEYYADAVANPAWNFTTTPGKEFYTTSGDALSGRVANLLATSPYLVKAHVLIAANRYPLIKRTWQYMEDTSVNPAVTGQPIDWAYFAETVRMYPIPDGTYPVSFMATPRFAALVNGSDTNCWTQDAYDLIKSEAKLILAREVLHDDDLATRMELAIYGASSVGGVMGKISGARGYLYALKAETTRRARSRIRPTHF